MTISRLTYQAIIHFVLSLGILVFYIVCMTSNVNAEFALVILMLVVFGWIYFSAGTLGISFAHPYRMFLIVFFLYTLSGFAYCIFSGESFFDYPFGRSPGGIWSTFVQNETLFAILFFMLGLHWALMYYTYRHDNNQITQTNLLTNIEPSTTAMYNRKIGLLLFFIFLLPTYYYYYVIIKEAVAMGGYMNYAFSVGDRVGTENMNILIRVSDDIFQFGFFLFLSSLPPKKKVYIPMILYFIPFLLLSTFTGSRVHVISQGMTLLIYYAMAYRVQTKKIILVLGAFFLLAMGIGILRSVENYNVQQAISNTEESENNVLQKFVLQQAMSAQTITMTINLHEEQNLDYSPRFLLEPLITTGGYKQEKSPDEYYTLADRIAYYYNKSFSLGGGLGSSVVAELYALGGMFAVMIGSVLFGLCVLYLSSQSVENPMRFCVSLLFLPGLLYTPRAYILAPITYAMTPLMLLLVYYVFIRMMKVK